MMGKGGQATVDCQENFTRTEAGISARATTHRGIQKRGYYDIKLFLNQRQCQKYLVWAKEKKN